jgi:tRNA threonylcarbamoyladenosine biosynthesis protein TsaB
MYILAIETTDLSGSVALLDDDRVLQMRELPAQPRSAATLAPAIDALFSAAGWKPADVKLIAVATGPGSFTGLRVGVTTAKMLAYAIGAEVIGVNTLEAIARQAPPQTSKIWAVIDAQRQQLFGCQFLRNASGQCEAVGVPQIFDDAHWLASLPAGSVVSGPGLAKLKNQLPIGVHALEESTWRPRAETIGLLGWEHYQLGRRDDLWSLAPQYFRPSAAEEKLQQSQLQKQ